MRGISKQLWRVILVAGVLLAVAVVAMWWIAPAFIDKALTQELHERDLPDARLEVIHAGPLDAAIEDLRLDDAGSLTVDSLIATYAPWQLLRGEIDTVRVVGARWVIRMHDRELDLGAVGDLLEQGDGQRGDARLPVRKIELHASELIVVTAAQRYRIPVEAVLERGPDGFRVHALAALLSQPVELTADVVQRPELEAEFLVTARGSKRGRLQLQGQLARDGPIDLALTAKSWSTDSVLDGRRFAVADLSVAGRATLLREPLELRDLQLELVAGDLRIDEHRIRSLTVDAARIEQGIDLDVGWAAARHEGTLGVRGLPPRLTPTHWQGARVSWRTDVTVFPDDEPVTVVASAVSRILRSDEQWSVEVDEGRLEVETPIVAVGPQPVRLRELRADVTFAATIERGQVSLFVGDDSSIRARQVRLAVGDEFLALEDLRLSLGSGDESPLLRLRGDEVQTTVELTGAGGKLTVADVRGTLRRVRVQAQAHRVAGQWELQGQTDVRLAPVVHEKSGFRIARVSASLPLRYPFTQDEPVEPGHVRVGPLRWRGSKLPALTGTLVQQADEVLVSLKWPLTSSAVVRGRGTIGLTKPLSSNLEITAPSFALEEAKAVAALAERSLGVSVTGRAAVSGQLSLEDGAFTQTLQVRLEDVALSRPGFFREIHGVAGTVRFDSIVPPMSSGGQRLTWEGGQLGRLMLGTGHVDFGVEKQRTVIVEEMATELGERGEAGRLFVGAFRYAPDQPELRLDLFAEALSLQRWLDLLGRDEVRGTGTLHGHVSATLQLEPTLQLHLGDGMLLAEPGGILELLDVRAAEAVLASGATIRKPQSLQQIVKQRLLEALQRLRYSSLRFEIIRAQGVVTLQAHVAGRGTRGARQEIGGLTININHFEDALNRLLRLRKGVEKLEAELPEEVSHVPSASQP